jgi:hypothetical protein
VAVPPERAELLLGALRARGVEGHRVGRFTRVGVGRIHVIG